MNEAQEEWVQVGGKGKPRRTPQQQQQHIEARNKAAAVLAAIASPPKHHHNHTQQNFENQICTAEQQQAAQQQLAAVAAAIAGTPSAQPQPLPGWGPPPEREWKVACSSKRKKKKGRVQLPATPEGQVQHICQQVQEIAQQLRSTQVFAALLAAMQQAAHGLQQQQQDGSSSAGCCASSSSSRDWGWSDIQQLVVYGLGSAEDSKVSRHQLALVLLLQQLLPGLQQPPQLYDPAFTAVDQLLLHQLGLEVISCNEEGRRKIEGPTCFYLPHCEGVLCDNLLCANATPHALHQLCILGNSFATYQQRWAGPQHSRPTTRRPDMLLQLTEQGVVIELPVADHDYQVPSAFNDMSLHVFKIMAAADHQMCVS